MAEHEDRFELTYYHCGRTWTMSWSFACNDRCPICSAEITPSKIRDLEKLGEDTKEGE